MLAWLCPIRPKLEGDREQHGRQGSEVEYVVFVRFLVPVSEINKCHPACRKGRCKLRLSAGTNGVIYRLQQE
jgi:hypothetical protein